MKLSAAILLSIPALTAAFIPAARPSFVTSALKMEQPPGLFRDGKPAASHEEDLELTVKVIMDYLNKDAPPEEDDEDDDDLDITGFEDQPEFVEARNEILAERAAKKGKKAPPAASAE